MAFTLNDIYTEVSVGEKTGTFTRNAGSDPSVSVSFVIRGADDASTAYSALITWLYDNYSDNNGGIASYNIPLSSVSIRATDRYDVYEGDCEFKFEDVTDESVTSNDEDNYDPPDVEDNDFSYEVTTNTSHITHSYQTLGAVATSGVPLDFGGGIGWNGEGFEGCDIETPTVSFEISVSRPKFWLKAAKRKALTNMIGYVNSVAWGGFDARCVLFCGFNASPKQITFKDSSGNEVKDWYWRLSYRFKAAPAVSLSFGGETLVKQGFDYLWRATSDIVNNTTGEIQSAVSQVNVERVYPVSNFSVLGLTFPSAV